jgi:hypothetical protein
MRAAGPESRIAAGLIELPFSISWSLQSERREEYVLPPSRRRLAAVVFCANAALLLSPVALASLMIAGVLR